MPTCLMACRLGADWALATRVALSSGCSQAPRHAPRLGNPFWTARVILACHLLPQMVAAGRGNRKQPQYRSAILSPFPSRFRSCLNGLPKRGALRGAGLRPPLKDQSLGRLKSAGADFLWRLPPSSRVHPWGCTRSETATRR